MYKGILLGYLETSSSFLVQVLLNFIPANILSIKILLIPIFN